MKDMSSKLNTFYKKHVVLSQTEKTKLRDRKKLNIDRLKEGLAEYNTEYKTNHKLVDDVVQGSVAMSTVVQSESNNYDIDVAIIFDKNNLPSGTIATKNIIVDALKRKCKQFNTEPELLTNCIRITYAEGYHIDFAVFRRFKNNKDEYEYEHCGSEWRSRDPRAITKWFLDANKDKDDKIRKIVRLLKMFCKSRSSWVMPGGLMLSVLVEECFQSYSRIDELFYYNIKAIKDRLKNNKTINNPVDTSQSLILKESDNTKITNLYNRLETYIEKLQVLIDDECTDEDALSAWSDFFNHDYWSNQLAENRSLAKSAEFSSSKQINECEDTEEFIEDIFPVEDRYRLYIDCEVTEKDNRTIMKLRNMIDRGIPLTKGKNLKFYVDYTNVPTPYKVFWKVRNDCRYVSGGESIRGEIFKNDEDQSINNEDASFIGNHYVEAYIIKNGVCVARDRISVPIRDR